MTGPQQPATEPGAIDASADSKPVSPTGIAGLIAANTSVLIAALVYMGWAYENAEYGVFHLSPIALNASVVEYMLYSLDSFSQTLVIAALVVILVSAAWAAVARRRPAGSQDPAAEGDAGAAERGKPQQAVRRKPLADWRKLPVIAGVAATSVFVLLYLGGFDVGYGWYLAVFGIGPLLFTWPYRSNNNGRFAYALAIVLAAVCLLWAGALYAQAQGKQHGEDLADGRAPMPAVTVYTRQPLELSGPGVTLTVLGPRFAYRFRYQGLHLLTARSGTYYLFPVRRRGGAATTYALDDSNGILVELT